MLTGTLLAAAPASACLPPPPGLSEEQRLKPGVDASTDIVYGVVTRRATTDRAGTFRVIHVYKGSLSPGAIIQGRASHGFDPPPCLGMLGLREPIAERGEYGVIAYSERFPYFNFINGYALDLMFKQGWIKSARR